MNIHLQSETKVLIVFVQIECNYNQFNSKTFLLHKNEGFNFFPFPCICHNTL